MTPELVTAADQLGGVLGQVSLLVCVSNILLWLSYVIRQPKWIFLNLCPLPGALFSPGPPRSHLASANS